MKTDFVAEGWGPILRHNGLRGFDDLWGLTGDWYEAPDHCHGAWSGVVCKTLELPSGGSIEVFIKLQENCLRRTLRHPIAGISTFEKEWRNLQCAREHGLSTVKPVYFAKRRCGGNVRAIIVTKGLVGFVSLKELVRRWQSDGWPPLASRAGMIRAVASELAVMHRHHLCHSSLYPKHLLISDRRPSRCASTIGENGVKVRLIDLESMRRCWLPWRAALRDLDCLNRHCKQWSKADRLRFLLAYLGVARLTPFAKRVCRQLERMTQAKSKSKGQKRPYVPRVIRLN